MLPAAQRALRGRSWPVVRGPGKGLRLLGADANPGYVLGYAEPAVQGVLVNVLRPGFVFYDVGASIGFHALIAARIVGEAGCVYAFEPDPETKRLLARNTELNGVRNVRIVASAVSDKTGVVRLAGSARPTAKISETGIEVPTVSLDTFGGKPPSLVKIDVEGHEAAVVRGMAGLLASVRPTVVYELHGGADPCEKLLRAAGYSVVPIDSPTGGMHHKLARPLVDEGARPR